MSVTRVQIVAVDNVNFCRFPWVGTQGNLQKFTLSTATICETLILETEPFLPYTADIYVACYTEVLKFDKNGKCIHKIGHFQTATGICINPITQDIMVADYRRVHIFNQAGQKIFT